MSSSSSSIPFFLLLSSTLSLVVVLLLAPHALSAADTSQCQSLLSQLVPCLSYVQGKAAVPPKQCCDNVLPIHLQQPQCLCELIVAAADHESDLPNLNVTLAIALGPACNIDTDPSRCPGLLGLAPGSSDAKIFPLASSNSTSNGTSPASSNSSSTTPATPSPNAFQQSPPNSTPPASLPCVLGIILIAVLSVLVL